jgi:hypothetical protein
MLSTLVHDRRQPKLNALITDPYEITRLRHVLYCLIDADQRSSRAQLKQDQRSMMIKVIHSVCISTYYKPNRIESIKHQKHFIS